MDRDLLIKGLSLFTFLNLNILSSVAYHQGGGSGATVSIPTYSDPVNFGLYLVLPAALFFGAIQQPIERKLEGKWRRDEPARKYSSIIAGLITAVLLISPAFHSFPTLNEVVYGGLLVSLAAVTAIGYKWEEVSGRLPV